MAANDPVSVVMPVRNAMPFLDEAVASILAQSHGNFELVIGDDGSSDGSTECLRAWARRDKRIRLLRNDGPGLGPSGSGNWVTRAAIHPLIARMDADDISKPDRLRDQLVAFQNNADAVLAGSLYECIDADSRRVLSRNRSAFIKPRCVMPVAHGSIMFRRDAFDRLGGYREQCDYWEDIDLFIRMGAQGRILILPEAHYLYRFSPTSSRLVSAEMRVARAMNLCLRCIDAHLGGRDYEDLLRDEAQAPGRAKLPASAMVGAAMGRLWGGDPRTIFSWMRRHTTFGWNRPSATILVFAGWALVHSASLRALIRLRTAVEDWRARHVVSDGLIYSWRPRRAAYGAGMRWRRERPLRAELIEDPCFSRFQSQDGVNFPPAWGCADVDRTPLMG